MKTTQQINKRAGFTLIEMVGVLAVIAILAALLVPKIFAAIEESKFNNTIGSVNNLKAATMQYFSKKSLFEADAGTTKFDQRLITNGDLERPFAAKLGDTWECNALAAASAAANSGFTKLDGASLSASGTVVQAVLKNVPAADALELSTRIDGAAMSPIDTKNTTTTTDDVPSLTLADDKGRVVYAAPNGGKTDVYVYIAHK